MKARVPGMIMAALVACNLAAAEDPAAGTEPVAILRTAERIQEQERRQVAVSRNLGLATARINDLLADLQANQLMDKGSGEAVDRMNAALVKLNTANVPRTIMELAKAREDLKVAFPHLDRAEKEVAVIIRELDQLLKEAGSTLVRDVLVAQIQEIIRTELFVKGETAQWGRQMFVNPQVAEADKHRLATAQQEVLSRLGSFAKLLEKAISETAEAKLKTVFVNAQAAMTKSNPDQLMKSAVAGINEKKVISAAGFQDRSLPALQEIEQILTAPEELVAASATTGTEAARDAAAAAAAAAMSPAGTAPMPGEMPAAMPGAMPGMMPGAMPGAMPGMGAMPGVMPGMGTMPGMMPGKEPPKGPSEDIGRTSDMTIGGSEVERTVSTDRKLAARQRDAAIQKYVQKTLPEFRKEVAEYYEVIAQ